MLSVDSLTSVAKSNILGDVPLHTIPPISGLEIMVHLTPSLPDGWNKWTHEPHEVSYPSTP
jgi:hypothetical protein